MKECREEQMALEVACLDVRSPERPTSEER